MKSNLDIYEFVLENIHKIIVPEELIKIEMSVSRFELLALMLAERHKNITMTALAQGMGVPLSTATGIIDRMVRKKLLQRERSEEDRRIVTVSLAERGRSLVEDFRKYLFELYDRVRGFLTEEEFETSLNLIRKIIAGFQKPQAEKEDSPAGARRTIKIE
ncbi:MAG: MarR family winged helix-turn-helix transcriptional regulator [Bacillota bacterium]